MPTEQAQSTLTLSDGAAETPLYIIPAAAMAARPRRALKYGDTFAIFDSFGDIGASVGGAEGLFHNDTRFLSQFEMLLNGLPPLLLGSNLRDDNALLSVDLTNPDYFLGGRIVLHRALVHVARATYLWRNMAHQRFAVRNHLDRPISLPITIRFRNDFADLFEVRGLHRERRGSQTSSVDGATVSLVYRGLDDKVRTTTLAFDPAPSELTTAQAHYRLDLGPGEMRPICVAIGCNEPAGASVVPFVKGMVEARRELRRATSHATSISTSNEILNEILRRSTADLHMLTTDTPQGRYPYAGIPWYSTTFGRDGLITALQMLWCDPSLARGVLRRLSAYQAQRDDPEADAARGKILHEMRSGEMAALHEIPFGLYYGSVDATPLFVLLAGLYAQRTGDLETVAALWPAIELALGWIDGPGDPDHDGLVEYWRATKDGLANQGWKDSYDAIFHADGQLAEGPIALAEVQGYVFAAKKAIAATARRLNRSADAERLEAEAQALAERFEEAFWCPELGFYAPALDGKKRPCRVRTSNAGQLLFTGIVRPERAKAVAEGLLEPRFFSGWGIRTVASGEARYNPLSYHNGSIWPHDNALIALGLARYGFKDAANRLFTGMFEAATYMDLRRLPELFCGFKRQSYRGPTLYPVACAPQAWASATPFSLIEAALGLELDSDRGEVRLRNPRLPAFVDEVRVRNLVVGSACLDLRVQRHGGVSVEALRGDGRVEVSVTSAP